MYDPAKQDEMPRLLLERTSNPILFVKNAGHGNNKKVRYSNAPVSHREVVAEIMYAVNSSEEYGSRLQEIGEGVQRERVFVFKQGDRIYVRALINGDVRDISSWSIVEDRRE